MPPRGEVKVKPCTASFASRQLLRNRPISPCPTPAQHYTYGSMNLETVIGLLAAACTTMAFLPQVIKNWRTRHTRDISIGWLVLLTIGLLTWIVYGVLRHDPVIIAANVATVSLVGIIIVLKTKYH